MIRVLQLSDHPKSQHSSSAMIHLETVSTTQSARERERMPTALKTRDCLVLASHRCAAGIRLRIPSGTFV